MYRDNTLTPKEAIRLCALGTLACGDTTYAALASGVRDFVGHMLGPSLDLMGPSLELLKVEGLVRSRPDDDGHARLALTDRGRGELHTLLTANLRLGAAELNKLVLALKFRFLDLLDPEERDHEIARIQDYCDNELARLEDLRAHHATEPGALTPWLDHDIDLLERRLRWLGAFRTSASRAPRN